MLITTRTSNNWRAKWAHDKEDTPTSIKLQVAQSNPASPEGGSGDATGCMQNAKITVAMGKLTWDKYQVYSMGQPDSIPGGGGD